MLLSHATPDLIPSDLAPCLLLCVLSSQWLLEEAAKAITKLKDGSAWQALATRPLCRQTLLPSPQPGASFPICGGLRCELFHHARAKPGSWLQIHGADFRCPRPGLLPQDLMQASARPGP